MEVPGQRRIAVIMSLYSYKASDISGKIMKGTLDASDEKQAAGKIQDMGYIPIRVVRVGRDSTAHISRNIMSLFQRVSAKDVMMFTQDLAALLGAGLPVDRALSVLLNATENAKFKEIVSQILKDVQGGSYLSDAMLKHSDIFSSFYVNMIRAGEAGGVLEPVLERLAASLESSQELKDYIISAMIYPIFLVMVGGISIVILMTFVIPKFAVIFSGMKQAIPLSTLILIESSKFITNWWWLILSAVIAGIWAIRQWLNTPSGRVKTDAYQLKMPIMGDLVKKIETARFSRTLGTLVKSGVPILQAILLVRDIIGNRIISGAMSRVYDRVKEGERLSKPLNESGLFPSLAVQMITVGEESGRLDEMLLRIADNYEKIIRNMIKRLISLLEPAMILVMGLMVGFIVISMLTAIFSMNDMPF